MCGKWRLDFFLLNCSVKVAEPIAEGKLIIRARKIAVDLLHSSIMLDEVLPVLVNGVMSSVDPNKSLTFR